MLNYIFNILFYLLLHKISNFIFGDWANPQSPIPNPQSPIPNPHNLNNMENFHIQAQEKLLNNN
jgi:hypothetical protein